MTISDDQPGIRKYLHRLWPDLRGKDLRNRAADALKVHASTVYEWERDGMARARFEHVVRFRSLCLSDLGALPDDLDLLQPSTAAVIR